MTPEELDEIESEMGDWHYPLGQVAGEIIAALREAWAERDEASKQAAHLHAAALLIQQDRDALHYKLTRAERVIEAVRTGSSFGIMRALEAYDAEGGK